MSLGLVLDARLTVCPRCLEVHVFTKVREGQRGFPAATYWQSQHVTQRGSRCGYFGDERPTAVSGLVEANPEAAS